MLLIRKKFHFIILAFIAFIFSSCKQERFMLPEKANGNRTASGIDSSLLYGSSINDSTKVLLIGIGGCRGDAMQIANAPNIHGLLSHSIYSYVAYTQAPSLSGPAWSSMLTGVWSNKHGVQDNSFAGSNFFRYPMFFKDAKYLNPGLRTVSICSWNAISSNVVSNADVNISTNENDEAVADSAVAHLKNDNPDVMFLQFDDVEQAGEKYGFDTTDSQYMQAITTVDGYVGNVLQSINSRPNIGKENWLIIIASDHGGTGNKTGGNSYLETNIFTIFYNKNFSSKEIVPPPNTVSFENVGEYAYSEDPFYNFDNIQQFTVQLEVRTSHLSSDIPFITNKDWESGSNIGWAITIHGQSWKFNASDGNNRVDVAAADGGAPNLSDNQWHNITLTVDRNSNVNLYQDGKLYGTDSIGGMFSTLVPQAIYKLVLADDITGQYKYYNGDPVFSEADVRLYDTVWNATDIANFQPCDTILSPGDPYYNHLIGFWRGTDGSGNIWKDYSPRHSDMQINGTPVWDQQTIDFCNMPLPQMAPTTVDIVPTILGWLNIPINSAWGLDGKSWVQ